MDNTVLKLDFPNPIEYIDIGDKPIIILFGKKKLRQFRKDKKRFKHIYSMFFINHKPYYYMVGCKNKENDFNIGWTVIGVNVIKS